ncbi:phospholipase D-like domain-containing protein [Achromobacter xylosoxidans]|uniref:phospholipase D-like domain-containing protein n=1 Tax=Alcaligenes xylosoxydans xylosoxydans TaxID=85698 RepID=UPI0006BFD048|nr:phospholipase D-like domain-containing protein [Achromobacter xylosoxidans]NEV05038.1 hypothetical protein [Achromobacter xylosoxidans]CUK12843.1 Uncharacterised protein [Achromobacter xylosoxidans]
MGITKSSAIPVSFRTTKVKEAWKRAVLDAEGGLVVFSPFITSNTAEEVLAAATKAQIHTRFDVKSFASGASSLATLKALSDAGHQIFHVDNLHAKIVLSKGKFVSIGSQNLTKGGTKNREITALFHGPDACHKVEHLVTPWLEKRKHVSPEMIDELEALMGPAAQIFAEAKKRTEALQRRFNASLKQRRERITRRRALLQHAIPARTASTETMARVEDVRGTRVSRSLKPLLGQHDTFTAWRINSKIRRIKPFFRFLCINEQTGHLGWARVAEKRITYVSATRRILSPKLRQSFVLRGVTPPVIGVVAPRRGDLADKGNLRIRFTIDGVSCSVRMWYSPGHLEVTSSASSDDGLLAQEFSAAMSSSSGNFQRGIIKALSEPFKFKKRLFGGPTADNFFGRKPVSLKLVMDENNPVLMFSAFLR